MSDFSIINLFINWHKNRRKQFRKLKFIFFFEPDYVNMEIINQWIAFKGNPFPFMRIQGKTKDFSFQDDYFNFIDYDSLRDNPIYIYGPASKYSYLDQIFTIGLTDQRLTAQINFDYISNDFSFVNYYMNFHGFIAASLYENNYVLWQSERVPGHYKYKGGLKIFRNQYGEKEVDLSDRPGRRAHHPKFTYCGASQMWFGEAFYNIIPKEKICSFDKALAINQLENNVLHVHLYETIFDGDRPDNQAVQRAFREHLEIDKITTY